MEKNRKPYKGQDFSKEVVLTKPNMNMELEEIIARFVRNEPLEIGHDVNYAETDDDIEKLQRLDPVDKVKYIRKMQDIQNEYRKQEAERVEAEQAIAREKFLQENKEKWLVEERAKGSQAPKKAPRADLAK